MKTKQRKKVLQNHKKDELLLDLCNAIARCKNIETSASLLSDLLTPKEIDMIAKRLRIASMLIDEHTYAQIRKELHVSDSTIARTNIWLNNSGLGFREAKKSNKKFDKSALLKKRKRRLSQYDKMVRKYGLYHLPEIIMNDLETIKRNKMKRAITTLKKSNSSKINIKDLYNLISINNTD